MGFGAVHISGVNVDPAIIKVGEKVGHIDGALYWTSNWKSVSCSSYALELNAWCSRCDCSSLTLGVGVKSGSSYGVVVYMDNSTAYIWWHGGSRPSSMSSLYYCAPKCFPSDFPTGAGWDCISYILSNLWYNISGAYQIVPTGYVDVAIDIMGYGTYNVNDRMKLVNDDNSVIYADTGALNGVGKHIQIANTRADVTFGAGTGLNIRVEGGATYGGMIIMRPSVL